MKILMVGDIVASAGRNAFARVVTQLKHDGKVDFVVANGENAAGGQGITAKLADEILGAGADVVTLGDHTWDQKDLIPYLDRESRVIRPMNFAPGCPGKGFVTVKTLWGDITVVNLVGRVFMKAYDCPFRTMDAFLTREPGLGKVILVDMHGEATSEMIVIGRYLEGRVSVVAGTHTHVQTSDETVLPKGTAYITDLGMTGGKDSAIGRDLKSVTNMFLTGMPSKWDSSDKDVVLEGMIVTVDEETGRAKSVKRIREPVS